MKHPRRHSIHNRSRCLDVRHSALACIARGFGLLLIVLVASLPLSLRAADGPSEAQVKAAFLLNFPKYVEWPATAFSETNSPVVVGIFAQDSVADEFAVMSQKKVIDGHPVQLLRVDSIDHCQGCHILFIGGNENSKVAEALTKLHGSNVLTVGESEDFIERGGMIELARRERRVVMEVDIDPIHEAGLKVSSKLLAVATVKGGKK